MAEAEEQAYTLYLKRLEAARKVKSIEAKMISSIEGGHITLVPLDELKKLAIELEPADSEYQTAAANLNNYLASI